MFSDKTKKEIKCVYDTSVDNIAKEMYVPLLSEAVLYRRVSAYFSLTSLGLYSNGLDQLSEHDGKVQFILSSSISEDDFNKIKKGYEYRKVFQKNKLNENIEDSHIKQNLGDLAYLISHNKADVKLAFMTTKSGIFHDKFGLISDEKNNIVFFTGSSNESLGGLENNYESLSIDVSWDTSEKVLERINYNDNRFSELWNGNNENIITKSADDLVYSEIKKYEENASESVKAKFSHNSPSNFNGFAIIKTANNEWSFKDFTPNNLSENDYKLKEGSYLDVFCKDDTRIINDSPNMMIDAYNLIKESAKKQKVDFWADEDFIKKFKSEKYSIDAYKTQGQAIKDPLDTRYNNEFNEFCKIVQNEVERKLKPLHLEAAFHAYMMQKSANFSVPGSGKTAMLLGTFAYLNSQEINKNEKIDRLLVVCPISAFNSWIIEFQKVFGRKKDLHVIDSQLDDFKYLLLKEWKSSNLVMVNYESLPYYTKILSSLLDDDTMLIFDEVHRIKNPSGKRGKKALILSKHAKFKCVLTGTPIPNSYTDIYNLLKILYGDYYESYFGWRIGQLKNPGPRKIKEINEKLYPFFWRVNKDQLGVPRADPNRIIQVNASPEQKAIAEYLWATEDSALVLFIRLMQLSTNPGLLPKKITFKAMGLVEENVTQEDFNNNLKSENSSIEEHYPLDYLDKLVTPKFRKGISIAKNIVHKHRKVIIWGIFVETLKKIKSALDSEGISAEIIYGKTPIDERTEIIDNFINSDLQVLISNPQTLGESISLHENVHDAIYFEYDFNLISMDQSRDRIHRLGLSEKQHTRYNYLETISNDDKARFIDKKIYNRLVEKEKIMNEAIDRNEFPPRSSDDYLNVAKEIISEERRGDK